MRLRRLDALLLLAGASLGISGPIVGSLAAEFDEAVAVSLSIGAALPLAIATRRLLDGSVRTLIASGVAAPMTALAVVAAEGASYASGPGWGLALLVLLPWPAALVLADARRRLTDAAVRKEIEEAERNYERRDYERSLDDYERAIRLTKRSSAGKELPWYGKGAALVILGRYAEALEAIDRALDINPYNEVAWLNKGNALTKMGRHMDALRCFNTAIKVNPSYEVAWNNKGNALARIDRYNEALRCYERAIELDPDYRGAWVNKGYVLAKIGRFDEAAACAERVLRLGDGRRPGPA